MPDNPKPHRGYIKPSCAVVDPDLVKKLTLSAAKNVIETFVAPKCSGRAWKVEAGHTCRFTLNEGSQVGDVNIWNFDNPEEHFYSGKTRQIHRSHLSTGDRLWSNMPYLKPLATVTADSLAGYTPDCDGFGVHDVLGTRCDPYMHGLITGGTCASSCHQYLTEAIKPFGLTEANVHDVFNIFMCTGIDRKTQEYMIKQRNTREERRLH